jgi:hypothetical protein
LQVLTDVFLVECEEDSPFTFDFYQTTPALRIVSAKGWSGPKPDAPMFVAPHRDPSDLAGPFSLVREKFPALWPLRARFNSLESS